MKNLTKNGTTTNNEVQTYNFMGNSIRLVMVNDKPWFIAKDVCDVLGMENPTKALYRLGADEKNTLTFSKGISRGNPRKNVINEPGLYSLVSRSNKPESKSFQRWVNHEVLSSIMKTGSYSVAQPSPQFMLPQNCIEALEALVASEKEADHATKSSLLLCFGRS